MLVEMKGIVKDFGPVRAVDNVDFTVGEGKIVGLLGENGAGKSTLMNVLAGTYPPINGEIFLNGKKVDISNIKVANKYGIQFIHQELILCNDLRVYENMFLGKEIKLPMGILDRKKMIKMCDDVFKRMKVNVDSSAFVEDLPASEKQLVEIGKALLFKSELIIMDEPSTALSTHEIENLFDIMRQLQMQGVSFVYISHKMPELFVICDVYYVLRDGKLVSSGLFKDVDENAITEMMIGRQLVDDDFANHKNNSKNEVMLSAKKLCGQGFSDISFDLIKGQILAITGLQGSGRDSVADALFGILPFTGTLEVKGKRVKSNTRVQSFMKRGISMVPRMRKERGIHNDLNIYDNIDMAYLNAKFKGVLISKKEVHKRFIRQKAMLAIKTDYPKNPITSLSGGNQQKVIFGKWLETDADILLFDNPTQGIDIGTKFEIYHLILRLAEQGKSVIVFSAEFPEIYKVADECIVLYKGKINSVLDRNNMTEKNMMYYSTGANLEGEKYA